MIVGAAHAASAAAAGELAVTVVPRSGSGLSQGATLVYLDGEIDPAAPERLAGALANVDGRIAVWLNSPGGNLFAGMQLGRLIRGRGASTRIIDARTLRAGQCYSACAMAFLGGVYRFNDNGARYGVHRASLPAGGADLGSHLTAAIASYIREMGVDARLLTLWQKAAPDEMYVLSLQEALDLGVANNGRQRPAWSVAASPGGALLQGRQETIDGTGLLVFSCDKDRTVLGSVYEASAGLDVSPRAEWTHVLTLDRSEDIALAPQTVSSQDGSVRATFVLPPRLVRLVMSASRIGLRMAAPATRAPAIDYHVDVDDVSQRKVSVFLRDCLREQAR